MEIERKVREQLIFYLHTSTLAATQRYCNENPVLATVDNYHVMICHLRGLLINGQRFHKLNYTEESQNGNVTK